MRSLLPVAFLLLAGCASSAHEGHRDPGLLVGFVNEGDARAIVSWDLARAGEPVADGTLDVPVNETREAYLPLQNVLGLTLSWSSEQGNASAALDPGRCGGIFHVVFPVAPATPPAPRVTECH